MSLWGNKDSKSVTGTIAATNGSNVVTGSGTSFLSELANGQTLVIVSSGNPQEYRIAAIDSDTSLRLASNFGGITQTGSTITANEQPAYIPIADLETVYGVDTTEATVQNSKLAHSGWVKRVTNSGGRSGRIQSEVLVANSSVSGDAEDTAFPDA
jgi:hypothetical protein